MTRGAGEKAYIGIDLAIAKNKRLPIVIAVWREGQLVPLPLAHLGPLPPRGSGNAAVLDAGVRRRFADDTATYLVEVLEHLGLVPGRIAIDAPRMARGAEVPRRAAEFALDAAGISCFTTPSAIEFEAKVENARRHLAEGSRQDRLPAANQLWMLAGFELFSRLAAIAECIEVYPQATARVLGAGGVHKSKAGAVLAQLASAARFTGWPHGNLHGDELNGIGFGDGHDRLDAYLSAWVAALPEANRVALGEPPLDVIWVPRVEGLCELQSAAVVPDGMPARVPRRSGSRPTLPETQPSGAFTRLCPACGEHLFKRWPFGWDAHAAHRCSGLEARLPDERKREYRARFAHLFKKG